MATFWERLQGKGDTLEQERALKKKLKRPVYRTVKVKPGPDDFDEKGRKNEGGVRVENVALRKAYLRKKREEQGKPPLKGPLGRAWDKMTS